MAFFEDFTAALKQKWVQYFQDNRDWLMLHLKSAAVKTPDGGRRPPSYFILGVMNVLEPKLAQLMYPFSQLNPEADKLIEVLGLNFDPDLASGRTPEPPTESVSPPPSIEAEMPEIAEDSWPTEDEGEEGETDTAVAVATAVFGDVASDEEFEEEAIEGFGESEVASFEEESTDLEGLEEEDIDEIEEVVAIGVEETSEQEDVFGDVDLEGLEESETSEDEGFGDMDLGGLEESETSEEEGFGDMDLGGLE
ncbi:MAG: hypothetical protein D6680_16855, partial [Cyanobacteria bacterium J007]